MDKNVGLAIELKNTQDYAQYLDNQDALRKFRQRFYIPQVSGKESIYFLGNSLGLQPTTTQDEVLKIMEAWANFGVEGFFMGKEPWLDYHKEITRLLCPILGANENELVTMNHLTVNLHLLMVTFYRPTKTRYKIICEGKAFPSDQYVFASQAAMHDVAAADAVIEVFPKEGAQLITTEDILMAIEANKDSVALVLFSGVNYFTGQVFDMQAIAKAAHAAGAYAGFDLAHAAGNIALHLHDWEADFACWCNYKYLNSGPGAIAGAFIHQKHLNKTGLKRMEGWWGNDIANRFKMEKEFTPSPSAEAWQLSTAPMLLLASHKASLKIFEEAGFENLLAKARQLSDYLFFVLNEINKNKIYFTIITPHKSEQRGCQVSMVVHQNAKQVFDKLLPNGIFADWREPNVIRIAPVPLYNSFEDIYNFGQIFQQLLTAD